MKITIKKRYLAFILLIPALLTLTTLAVILLIKLNGQDLNDIEVSNTITLCETHDNCESENEICIQGEFQKYCEEIVCDNTTICPVDTLCEINNGDSSGYCVSQNTVLGIANTRTDLQFNLVKKVPNIMQITFFGFLILLLLEFRFQFLRRAILKISS